MFVGIVFISALSYYLTDSAVLTKLLNAVSHLIIIFSPLLYYFITLKNKKTFLDFKKTNLREYLLIILCLSFGVLLGYYTFIYGGQLYVEPFGVALSCLYAVLIASEKILNKNPST